MDGFGYSVVASSLLDAESVDRILAAVRGDLERIGGREVSDPLEAVDRPHVIVMASGGTERAALQLVAVRHSVVPWEPVVLVAHPSHNSLPAALEALARVRADGAIGMIVHLPSVNRLARVIDDLDVMHRLRGARLGLVGEPSEWLVASVPDRDLLRSRWGIELVDVDIDDTIERHRSGSPAEAREVAVHFTSRAEPAPELLAAAELHPALVESMEESDVGAIAVRCFDFITELSTSGCVALAQLNDTGVVAGCEGDVASTVAMMLVREMFGMPSWIANPAGIDEEANTLLLAHCTVAPSMVYDLELHTHFESDLGIGLRGSFARGWVTLLRLGGSALERHRFLEAEILESGDSPDLCRTQVTLRVADHQVGEILADPLGNHLVMVRGRHRDRLEQWWRLAFGED